MSSITVQQATFEENLRQNINFKNYLAFETENNPELPHNDEYIQLRINEKNKLDTVESGFYITDFFLKSNDGDVEIDSNKNYKFSKIYEDKTTLVEKLAINEQTTSSVIQNLNRNVSKLVQEEVLVKTADANDIGYFFIAFPIVILQEVFVILINFLDLPFNIEFLFNKRAATSIVTAELVVNDRKNITTDYNTIIENGLRDANPNNIETRLFHVKQKTASYTDFLKELYTKKFTSFEEIKQSKDFENYSLKLLNNFVIGIELKGNDNVNFAIKQSQDTASKNITYYKDQTDARKMYWGNCIDNKTTKDDNQTNKLSNYYDIAFDCRYLKAFSFSNYTAGFHVIDYQPSEIFKNISLEKNLNGSINLFEVYKEVFKNKIIEFEAQPVV